MRYLAIDYGLSHVGIAISDGILAEPYGQVAYVSDEKLADRIISIGKKENIDVVVVGISEGEMAQKIKDFTKLLKIRAGITVELFDETLSSQEAMKLMVEAGKKRSQRQKKGHQTAAALILQEYLDAI